MKNKVNNEIRIDQLTALLKAGSIDEKGLNELKEIGVSIAVAKKARSDAIEQVIDAMTKIEPPLGLIDLINASPTLRPNINDLYDADTILASVKAKGYLFKRVSNAGSLSSAVSAALKAKELGMLVLVLKVPKAKGSPTKVYQNSPLPLDTSQSNKLKNSFLHVKTMPGDIVANLKSFVIDSPEVQNFLKSSDGEQFMSRWAGWISRGGKRK